MGGMLWEESLSLPIAPPPVYQKEAHSTETALIQSSVKSLTMVKADQTEKGIHLGWEGYEEEDLPKKVHGHILRNLRHQIFTLYRRLFGVVFVVNVAILIATLVNHSHDAQSLGLIVIANIFCAVLMRQDYVINAFFNVCCAIPPS